MEESKTWVTYEIIKRLINESQWGQEVTVNELLGYLYDEIEEFSMGCCKKENENILEEAADVLMLILYILEKKNNGGEKNSIDILLENINKKLQSRYAVFFSDSGEDEEEYWTNTKYIEKEILNYLYCDNFQCEKYGRANRGHMLYNDGTCYCCACGRSQKVGERNLLLGRARKRRNIFDNLLLYLEDYAKGRRFSAESYFVDEKKAYFRIVRYIFLHPAGYQALRDYCLNIYPQIGNGFDDFFMSPLRNYLEEIIKTKNKKDIPLDINDLLIKCIDFDYVFFRKMLCPADDVKSLMVWKDYFWKMIYGMQLQIESIPGGDAIKIDENRYVDTQRYDVHLDDKRKIEFLVSCECSMENRKIVIRLEGDECNSNCQIMQVVVSINEFLGIQNVENVKIYIYKIKEKIHAAGIIQVLSDFFENVVITESMDGIIEKNETRGEKDYGSSREGCNSRRKCKICLEIGRRCIDRGGDI